MIYVSNYFCSSFILHSASLAENVSFLMCFLSQNILECNKNVWHFKQGKRDSIMKIKCIFHFYLFFLFPSGMLENVPFSVSSWVLLDAKEVLKTGNHAAKQIFNIAISLDCINPTRLRSLVLWWSSACHNKRCRPDWGIWMLLWKMPDWSPREKVVFPYRWVVRDSGVFI